MTTNLKAGNIIRKTKGKWAGKGRTFMVLAVGKRRLRLQPMFKVGGYEFFPISETISGRWVLDTKAAAA
jgi:hypothetical protein